MRYRNITFPTADSSREVNLTCPIRPGALSERYTVRWQSSTNRLENFGNYDIAEDINPTSGDHFQCIVTILHIYSEDIVLEVYNGPMIVLNKIGKIEPM